MKRFLPLLLASLVACSPAQVRPSPPVVAQSAAPLPSTLLPAEAEAILHAGIDPATLHCNGIQTWNPHLRADAKAAASEMLADLDKLGATVPADKLEAARKALTDVVMWRMVRATLVDGDQNNLGAVAVAGVRTRSGAPLLLYRTGFTPKPDAPGSCYASLVQQGGVRHVVNLYGGPMPTADLEAGERATVQAAGGTYFTARDAAGPQKNWREDMREGQDPRVVMQAVAAIIAEVLQPGGQAPAGNVLVHCGGGMHRTGMVVGIIERCVNHADPAVVEAGYKRHVGWRSAQEPGGFEPANLQFIQGFDCGLLHPTQSP
jgi:hypothetical protein